MKRYLTQHHPENLTEFHAIISAMSLDQASRQREPYIGAEAVRRRRVGDRPEQGEGSPRYAVPPEDAPVPRDFRAEARDLDYDGRRRAGLIDARHESPSGGLYNSVQSRDLRVRCGSNGPLVTLRRHMATCGRAIGERTARILATFRCGGMAEWSMAVVLKTGPIGYQ